MAPENPLADRFRRWQQARADQRLFKHLGQVHRLERRQMELLVALADQHRLTRLSEIFLRPSLFSATPAADRWSRSEVTSLAHQIFEGPPVTDASDPLPEP